MRYQIKALNLGGILDQAITLLKNHFVMLLTITLFLLVPFTLVSGIAVYALTPETTQAPSFPYSQPPAVGAGQSLILLSGLFGLLTAVFVFPLTNAATIRAVAKEYLDQPTTAVESFKYALRVFVPLILTNVLAWIIIALPLIVVIVPGILIQSPALLGLGIIVAFIPVILLVFRYWFVSHVVIIEGTWGSAALKRSGALMKGNMATAFVLGLLLGIIGAFVQGAAQIVPGLLGVAVETVFQAVLFVFGAAAGVVFYFAARCKLEHFDLQLLADAVAADARGPETTGPGPSPGVAE
jgi:hypothetical protein